MKIYKIVLMCALVSPMAFAKPKGLSEAFKQAVSQSEAEKTKSEIFLDIDQTSRLSSWRDRSPLVVRVDSSIIQDTPATILRASTIPNIDATEEAHKAIEKERKDLH